MSAKPAASATLERLNRYFDEHADRFLADLDAVLRIPSISTEARHRNDVRRCAEHVRAHLAAIGMERAEVIPTPGHPIVYAEWRGAPGRPTVLLYGHYDVQPVEPLDLWTSPPFEPVVRDGRLYARGAADDKGQVYMHLAAIEGWMRVHGGLPVNIKILIEGEEENGSDSLYPFIERERERLACDVVVVSDTTMLAPDQPALVYGLRGLLYTQIEVTGPARDLHSGHFGGAVANPGNALAQIIAGLKDGDGRITVPGFYDDVRALSATERADMARVPFDERGFLAEAGAPAPFGENGYTTLERVTARPTLDVNGMWGGYQGEGAKTVLPSFFAAKVSMRLVPDQDPKRLFPLFEAHVRRLLPPGVSVTVRNVHDGQPFLTDPAHPMLEAARRALAQVWDKPPVMIREGGSIPVMTALKRALGVPFIFMGFGLDDDNVHAPNEKFSLSSFHGGIRSAAALYEELGRGA
jgi:acetylornithine deacetylase/succinyl-diaminopimelate desuccinylase-like protein